MSYREYRLINKLKNHVGRGNAIPGDQLCKELGFKDTRALREVVEGLRKEHLPIMSLPGVGYWWPMSWGEDEHHCINNLRDMGKKFFWAAEGAEKGLKEEFGDQRVLF